MESYILSRKGPESSNGSNHSRFAFIPSLDIPFSPGEQGETLWCRGSDDDWHCAVVSFGNESEAHAKADSPVSVKGDEKEVNDLLTRWRTVNGIRSVLPLIGGAIAVAAVVL